VADLALARMQTLLDEWGAAGDRRAVFLDCYQRMTAAMDRGLAAGDFADAAWVERLLDRFADYYFVTVDGWHADRSCVPAPWVVAHEAAERGAATPQLLLAGVNAHINYDLALTLVDLLGGEWAALDDEGRAVRRDDYDRVNDVIRRTADEVQDEVLERHAPALALLDPLMGRIDEWSAVRLLTGWRDSVWRDATTFVEAAGSDRSAWESRRAEQCARRGRRILLDRG
jgi:hypothetical protein